MMTNKDVIVLLSGGLDSLATVALLKDCYNIVMALHISYGQKPSSKEVLASKKICDYYGIKFEVVNLDWYEKISTNSALSSSNKDEKESYWMPNRNGLFLNIAASYADAMNCKYIAIGANKEEAEIFSDNSKEFIQKSTELFKYSTQLKVEVIAPLINMAKKEIIEKIIELNAPIEFVWSCYDNKNKHCGHCPSCEFLLKALNDNNKKELIEKLF